MVSSCSVYYRITLLKHFENNDCYSAHLPMAEQAPTLSFTSVII
jgi:hypothetical protein